MITVYKVIADKKPPECLLCPLKSFGVKVNKGNCGRRIKTNLPGGWLEEKTVPDERCVFEVR